MYGGILLCLFLVGNSRSLSLKNNDLDKEPSTNNDFRTGNGEWHINVTMHVYSGRRDPSWLIPYSHPAYNVIVKNINGIPTKPLPSKLGYKGFSLVHISDGENFEKKRYFNRTVTSLPDWELYLLQTYQGDAEDLRLHAKQSILKTVARRKRRSLYNPYNDYDYGSLFYKPTTVDPINSLSNSDMMELAKLWGIDKRFRNITAPPPFLGPTRFEPFKWNKRVVKEHNNCYNYANNKITDTFAQPGRAGNCNNILLTNGTNIEKLAKCDGLRAVFTPNMKKLPDHKWNLVALVFWPPTPGSDLFDFHWYRLDADGHWSHKPGKTSATNIDQSGKPITDPRYADRGPYTQFVGFLETRLDKVLLI
ncbi:uncharacterized protein LOC132720429 [Ruditapes philippinarum]|uniref:uncharacterized protein LOC132720429 n=1 Tax=Ruditapes philippinarum TaxID=129788 RepID=UPI00295B8C56|nr:uncharacterized protein LOC132720429 [Ruditapes philippinarum]